MQINHGRAYGLAAVTVAGALVAGSVALGGAAVADDQLSVTPVAAQDKVPGVATANVLSPELEQIVRAQGSTKLENPSADGVITNYGYLSDGPFTAVAPSTAEAHKTEPDKNTYLVLNGQRGADPGYRYGTHFLFQGHETGPRGYITRVNLDADAAHRVTLFASTDVDGKTLPNFDGSTYDPFTRTLLFTAENGTSGGVWESGLDFVNGTARVRDISGALGRGGYEGVQIDSAGQVWLIEDVAGPSVPTSVRTPKGYLYRFVPTRPGDLSAGRLQALQILDTEGNPIGNDPLGEGIAQRYTYGNALRTKWVTIHDTAVDGSAPFDANAAATAAGATPMKRPENGVFRPGSKFREFYLTETGDTNVNSTATPEKSTDGRNYGGWGGIFKVSQSSPTADSGTVELVYTGDAYHAGFDNVAFADRDSLLIVEDAGDTLHTQRGKLDSGYVLDVSRDWSKGGEPVRFLGEGRDASATLDSALQGTPGFPNDGDNEITGIHVSDGDASIEGLLGAKRIKALQDGARVFWTQQHGDNVTYEIVPNRGARD